jgi:AraC-like DNA-binding protein
LVSQLQQRLGDCDSFEARARVTDRFLSRICRARPSSDGISSAANQILLRQGEVQIGGLADAIGLSLRQFERRFTQQIGVRPKVYARIARFEAALDSKARPRAKSWAEIVCEFGYYDQMHLVHDFEQFSGETPTDLLTEVEKAHRSLIQAVRLGRIPASHPEPRCFFQ